MLLLATGLAGVVALPFIILMLPFLLWLAIPTAVFFAVGWALRLVAEHREQHRWMGPVRRGAGPRQGRGGRPRTAGLDGAVAAGLARRQGLGARHRRFSFAIMSQRAKRFSTYVAVASAGVL